MGAAHLLPDEVALDGVEEFLFTCVATTSAWPHKPTSVNCHTTEGRSWRLTVDGNGARSTRIPSPGTEPAAIVGDGPEVGGASALGTAAELVLVFHGRIPLDSLKLDGDRRIFDQLLAWEPEE
ncbi:hypothetical protein ACFWFI_39575 [Streptomyces sp. NPDC060209]|uniref:hypothetical protein n=1 Tax=Streptomyces sp. NPDC060209 TaxID=3347073 RepID=UPI003648270B